MGHLVTSFGIGMGIGMATSNKLVDFVERENVFVWSIMAAAGTLSCSPRCPRSATRRSSR